MKFKILLSALLICLLTVATAQKKRIIKPTDKTYAQGGLQDRAYWSHLLYKIASPVILNLANSTLKKTCRLKKLQAMP
ncbi:hypothetical protein [Niabella ginsengisoli]|uniref:Uncharacterized protein n=1 Tax=Niabella ginsengisoli TaxID=522298 RepID=A0ABS9SF80_9BACT|nr:hypothetical protein [Niabella ginsengisoli]MCH5597018.1 hypothetical protein [Niabella ginsengisoli]